MWLCSLHHFWVSYSQLLCPPSKMKTFSKFMNIYINVVYFEISTDQYPRNTGLTFSSVTIIAGVAMLGRYPFLWPWDHEWLCFILVQVLIEICLLIPHNLDTVIVNTKIPLHQPKSYLTRRNSSKRQSRTQKNNLCNNDELYLGQTVQDQFKPAKTKWKITRLTTFKSSSDYHNFTMLILS